MAELLNILPHEFAEKFLYLNGKPLSLQDYKHLYAIYDNFSSSTVLKFSRQTAKSSTLANKLIISSIMIPYFKSFYISPTLKQTKLFSNDRVAPVLESSPIIKDFYTNSTLHQNVFNKTLLNGSKMYFGYALLNADKLRGISADMTVFDEVQDFRADLIPIIQESMSHSKYKITYYAGTPKRSKGTLATLWQKSTMNEYAIKCSHCGTYNILDESNIGPHGVICSKCFRSLNLQTAKGEWVSTYSLTQKPIHEGYRICLLHFENADWVNWEKDVIQKRDNTSKSTFYNETLALEYDDGVAPLNVMQLQSACSNDKILKNSPDNLDKSYSTVMAIDYGPVNSENSRTVMAGVQRRAEKYVVVFMKRFLGKEAEYSFIHKYVPEIMDTWNATYLAADYGMGEAPNSEIRSRIGSHRLIAFQHMPNQQERIRWNSKMPAYTLNRTSTLTSIFNAIKSNKIEFPRWDFLEPFADDFLNVQLETDEITGKTKYTSIGPDDMVHALTYGILLLDMQMGSSLLT